MVNNPMVEDFINTKALESFVQLDLINKTVYRSDSKIKSHKRCFTMNEYFNYDILNRAYALFEDKQPPEKVVFKKSCGCRITERKVVLFCERHERIWSENMV